MKMKIYKYPLHLVDTQTVEMPKGAKILTAQMQNNTICLWALVDIEPELPTTQNREIKIIGTGELRNESPGRHVSTVQSGQFVWHVFERE